MVILIVVMFATCRCAIGDSAYFILLKILSILKNLKTRAILIDLMTLRILRIPPIPMTAVPCVSNVNAVGPELRRRSGIEARKIDPAFVASKISDDAFLNNRIVEAYEKLDREEQIEKKSDKNEFPANIEVPTDNYGEVLDKGMN